LDALVANFQSKLRAAREPVVKSYLDTLAKSSSSGAESGVVKAESDRVMRLLQNTKGHSRVAGAGFETLEGIHYVPHKDNSGDKFQVEHEGQKLWVRLMWVTAPPTSLPAGAALTMVKERLGLDDLQALAAGQAAREFTELYLTSRPLKLLTRATPAPDGTLLALVYVEPVGLFQHVLIDQRLAVVDAPNATGSRPALEAGLLAAMKEHEKRAREGKTTHEK
jgi:hypothetical protein